MIPGDSGGIAATSQLSDDLKTRPRNSHSTHDTTIGTTQSLNPNSSLDPRRNSQHATARLRQLLCSNLEQQLTRPKVTTRGNSLDPSYSNLQRKTRLEPRTHLTTRVHDPSTLVMSHQSPATTAIPFTYHLPPYNSARLPIVGELFKFLSGTGESDLFAFLRLITSLASFSGFVLADHWPFPPPDGIGGADRTDVCQHGSVF